VCHVSGDAWFSVATSGISTMTECRDSLAIAAPYTGIVRQIVRTSAFMSRQNQDTVISGSVTRYELRRTNGDPPSRFRTVKRNASAVTPFLSHQPSLGLGTVVGLGSRCVCPRRWNPAAAVLLQQTWTRLAGFKSGKKCLEVVNEVVVKDHVYILERFI
jgi:hypothetical protein